MNSLRLERRREQRTPFAGDGVLFRRAADEYVAAIKFADQTCRGETGNCFNRCQTEPCGICQLHGASMTRGGTLVVQAK